MCLFTRLTFHIYVNLQSTPILKEKFTGTEAQCRKTRDLLSLKTILSNQHFSYLFVSRKFCQNRVKVKSRNFHTVQKHLVTESLKIKLLLLVQFELHFKDSSLYLQLMMLPLTVWKFKKNSVIQILREINSLHKM